jgi:hypothetical protein
LRNYLKIYNSWGIAKLQFIHNNNRITCLCPIGYYSSGAENDAIKGDLHFVYNSQGLLNTNKQNKVIALKDP